MKPHLLAERGEDEVGVLLGQEIELALGAEQEALAGHAARAERDLRLGDVIAGAQRILLRVEEDLDAAALVVVQPRSTRSGAIATAAAAPPMK